MWVQVVCVFKGVYFETLIVPQMEGCCSNGREKDEIMKRQKRESLIQLRLCNEGHFGIQIVEFVRNSV